MNAVSVDVPTEGRKSGIWRLYPIGDLHKDKKSFDEKRLKKYLDIISEDPYGMWVLMGDVIDGTTPDHKFFHASTIRLKDLENIDDYVTWQLDELEKLLTPLKGKPGVIVQGNHDKRGPLRYSGLVKELAKRLGAEYGGYECLIRVRTLDPQRPEVSSRVRVIYAQHGSGGGMYPGAKINRLQNTSFTIAPSADVYLRAHVHDSITRVLPLVDITRKGPIRLVKKPVALLIAPSFAQGRTQGVDDYDGEKALPITDEGIVYLEIENASNEGPGRMTRCEVPF